ncbi:hypothetical protein HPB48_016420 [Haemaphysalis longicornis]|uniref:Uncharacterized protein n=1 Tax=Haemaphysalis longicornis TaxID=44386 RepID=A0A9J6F9Q8_HAELO|nr:hypothetical protein HPB48_016420 [Haemaphysalis longicornis]
MLDFNILDTHVLLHGATVQYTWEQGRTRSRLDRVYISSAQDDTVTVREMAKAAALFPQISDHSPVGIKYLIKQTEAKIPQYPRRELWGDTKHPPTYRTVGFHSTHR